MRVVQTTVGVFHQFELARELHRRGHLQKIFSTWPWTRLKREGLPRSCVGTFPWIAAPAYVLGSRLPPKLDRNLSHWNVLAYDRWLRRNVSRCDVLIGLSGVGLLPGRRVQGEGGIFVCDRGSSHVDFVEQTLEEESERWDVPFHRLDPRGTERERESYAIADAITVPSTFSARTFQLAGVPKRKLHTIPYGVLLETFSPAPTPPPVDSFDVLFVGGVSLRKGVPYLLSAFSKLQTPAKRLRVVGSVQPEIKTLLERLPQENVVFTGPLPRAEVLRAMQTSHVMVLPSVEDGFGLVVGEAMASGCPVIGTENTGAPDIVTDGEDGFVVPIRNADALAERLQRLADDRSLQLSMREMGLRKVQLLGGWHHYGSLWEELLHSLIRH